MEEVENTKFLAKDISEYLKEMYHRVEQNNPVTGWANGVRIIMFMEEAKVDPHYDGPK